MKTGPNHQLQLTGSGKFVYRGNPSTLLFRGTRLCAKPKVVEGCAVIEDFAVYLG
ncbi:MAG: hypothetical protein ACKV22_36220 [Bryobacteraceae bacterium]